MGNETDALSSAKPQSEADVSAVGQTANIGRGTSVSGGAAKVFREFKWGLLTLFLLMVVVIGLVYDGGRKKKSGEPDAKVAESAPEINLDGGSESSLPPATPTQGSAPVPGPASPRPGPTELPVVPPPAAGAPESAGLVLGPQGQRPPRTSAPAPTDTFPPRPTPAPVPVGDQPIERTYVVKPGDTLTRIASTVLPGKGTVKALVDANKDVLPDPNRLRVGMTLKIPAAPAANALPPKPLTDSKKAETVELPPPALKGGAESAASEYIVQNGDTLERIARKLFNDGRKWRDLYDWNRDQLSDPGRLRLGQSLKIKSGSSSAALPATGSARVEAEPEVHASPKKVASTSAVEENEVEVMNRTSAVDFP